MSNSLKSFTEDENNFFPFCSFEYVLISPLKLSFRVTFIPDVFAERYLWEPRGYGFPGETLQRARILKIEQ